MRQMGCPSARKRRPVVLRVQEVQTLLSHQAGTKALSGPARLPPSGFSSLFGPFPAPAGLLLLSKQD
jgi:hypothetical protein